MIPSFPPHNVLVRNVESVHTPIRSFYLSNTLVKAIITHNDYRKFRLTAAGTKVFTKQEAGKGFDAQYRVLGEGLAVVLPFVEPSAILTGSLSALRTFLESYYPLVATFEEKFREQIDESRCELAC
jgi:multisite-specific tRNA:(cytosine-C5)-methyltransferase